MRMRPPCPSSREGQWSLGELFSLEELYPERLPSVQSIEFWGLPSRSGRRAAGARRSCVEWQMRVAVLYFRIALPRKPR